MVIGEHGRCSERLCHVFTSLAIMGFGVQFARFLGSERVSEVSRFIILDSLLGGGSSSVIICWCCVSRR